MEAPKGPPPARKESGTTLVQRPPRILLAEDDPETRAAMSEALSESGFSVVEARDGNEFLNLMIDVSLQDERQRAYDAIITDVFMPGFSGIDVLIALRRSTAFTPVIIVTGKVDAATLRTAERLGVVAVFRKPIDLQEVREVLDRSLKAGLPGAFTPRAKGG